MLFSCIVPRFQSKSCCDLEKDLDPLLLCVKVSECELFKIKLVTRPCFIRSTGSAPLGDLLGPFEIFCVSGLFYLF